jgi:arylsulfatase A-like enzyme
MSTASPVLLLTIDSLRSDRFNSACFPKTWSTFESDFATFSSALAHGNATPLAFPSIITSRPVTGDGTLPSEATTIAELFDDRQTSGFSNNGHLIEERGYHRGFDSFHDLAPPDTPSLVGRLKQIDTLRESEIVTKAYRLYRRVRSAGAGNGRFIDNFPNPKTTADAVSDFVIRRLSATPKSFVWAHYMDPHKPYHPDQAIDGPEMDRSRAEIKALNSYGHSKDPVDENDMDFLKALYESNIRYLDKELARLFDWLQTENLYDDALIVVVSDHGDLFGEHGLMFHPLDVDPHDELIETPLLVKYPSNRHGGETFDHPVQHADISPTIAEYVAVPGPEYEHAHQLTETTPRYVVSKSNVAVRVTEDGGTGLKRRDGTRKGVESLSEYGRELLQDASFPEVSTQGGNIKGVEEHQRRKRLKQLGYR